MGKLTPTRRPTSALLVPSAASNTIRARCAKPAGIVEDRVHSRSLCSSPARNTNGSTRDMNHCLNHRQQSHFQHATLTRAAGFHGRPWSVAESSGAFVFWEHQPAAPLQFAVPRDAFSRGLSG